VARVDPGAMDRPIVRLLHRANGERMSPVEIDLRRTHARLRGVIGVAQAPVVDAAAAGIAPELEP
jgi:hypothetical protein